MKFKISEIISFLEQTQTCFSALGLFPSSIKLLKCLETNHMEYFPSVGYQCVGSLKAAYSGECPWPSVLFVKPTLPVYPWVLFWLSYFIADLNFYFPTQHLLFFFSYFIFGQIFQKQSRLALNCDFRNNTAALLECIRAGFVKFTARSLWAGREQAACLWHLACVSLARRMTEAPAKCL